MRAIIKFFLQAVGVGLVAAMVLIFFIPERDPEPALLRAPPHTDRASAMAQGRVSYADAVDRAAPSVVNIYTRKTLARSPNPLLEQPLFEHFFGDEYSRRQRRTVTSLGSGVIVNSRGYVLTSNHVIADADEIEVLAPSGINVAARVVGADPESDLAVLKVEREGLPAITVGDSRALRVGDVVLAIGNPFGVGQTVTQGIVSATGRDSLGINTFEDYIQTDAAINQGNSGGALINAYGELVGINTAILSRSGGSQGIGFAVPASLAQNVVTQIIKTGKVVRGWLGVEAQDLSPQLVDSFDLRRPQGVLVAGVVRKGPAQLAGIAPGDVITQLDGQPVRDAKHALNLIARRKPGEIIHVHGERAGRGFDLRVSVIQRPAPAAVLKP